MRSQASSARVLYLSWAGWGPPLQSRYLSSHWRAMRLSWPNRCSWGCPSASRKRVSSRWEVSSYTTCEGRTSPVWTRFRSTCAPMMPLLRRRDHGLGVEVEGNAEHVGVFDVEALFCVELVGLAAQCAANHLLAKQLGAKGAHAENMGHGVGVPALGQHGDGDHASDGVPQPARLAHGVHHLAQQVLVGDLLAGLGVPRSLDDFAAESVDLIGG